MSLLRPKVKNILIFVTIVGLVSGIYWFSTKKDHLFSVMPNDVAVVIELDSWEKFQNKYATNLPESVQVFKSMEAAKMITADYDNLAYYAQADSRLHTALSSQPIAIGLSLHPSDANHAIFLMWQPDGFVLQTWLDQLILTGRNVKKYNNNGQNIHEIIDQKGKKICVGQSGKILIFSQLSWMIEESLALSATGIKKAWSSSFFRTSSKVHDAEVFSLYLSGDACSKRLQEWLRPEYQFVGTAIQATLSTLALQWTEGGATMQLESLNDNTATDIILQTSASTASPIEAVIPDNTSLALQMQWKPKQWQQLLFSGKDANEFHQFLQAWSNYQFAVAVGEPLSGDIADDCHLAFGVQNEATLQNKLQSISEITDYQSFKIYRLEEAGPFKAIFQKIHHNPKHIAPHLYCSVLGKWLVAAWQPSAIEIMIDKYIVGQVLAQSTDYLLAQPTTSAHDQKSSTLFWNNRQLPNILDAVYQEPISNISRKILMQSGWVSLQKHKSKANRSAWSPGFQQGSMQDQTPQYVWKIPFEAEVIGTPQVVNLADSTQLILVQDALYKLHCTNTNGEVRWTKSLDGPLLSQAYKITPFDERNPAILCNTAGNIYLFEAKQGDPIGGFPIQLRSKASNGLLPIYDEGKHENTFFLANENGFLYGFDQLGRPLEGWNGQHNPGKVSRQLVHYRYENKDFIVAVSDQGIITTLGKHGEVRIPRIAAEIFPSAAIMLDTSGAVPRIIFSDAVGEAVVCNAKGEVFRMPFGNTTEPQATALALSNYSGDKRLDYAILQGKTLQIKAYQTNNTLKTVLNHTFGEEQENVFVPNNISSSLGIVGTYTSEQRQITMIKKGKGLLPGFPLAGTTPYALLPVQHDKYLLIVGDGTSLNAYRIARF